MKHQEKNPDLPADAYAICVAYADVLGLSIAELCVKAKVSHSTVYRWRTKSKKEGYSVRVFIKIRDYYRAAIRKKAPK